MAATARFANDCPSRIGRPVLSAQPRVVLGRHHFRRGKVQDGAANRGLGDRQAYRGTDSLTCDGEEARQGLRRSEIDTGCQGPVNLSRSGIWAGLCHPADPHRHGCLPAKAELRERGILSVQQLYIRVGDGLSDDQGRKSAGSAVPAGIYDTWRLMMLITLLGQSQA